MKIIDSSSLEKYVNKEDNWEEIETLLVAEDWCTLLMVLYS